MKLKATILFLFIACFPAICFAKKTKGMVSFRFYGSQWSVRVSDQLRIPVPDSLTEDVFDTTHIEMHIRDTYDDCINLKFKKQLNDWAYMKMLDSLSLSCFSNIDEAVLLKSYLMVKSGYDIILLKEKNHIHMGYYTKSTVYGKAFYPLGDKDYYVDENFDDAIFFPFRCKGRPISFDMRVQPLLDYARMQPRLLESGKGKVLGNPIKNISPYPLSIEVSVNRNLLDFYAQYPSTMKNYDFTTRWSMVANVPMDVDLKKQVYPYFKEQLRGLSQYEAVERLLDFVQTALSYEYDDDVWGKDRAFFTEETLFYPYSDNEDRVILLSRLIRDLVGLEVVLLYFNRHLSMAVHFDDEVEGASVIYNGDRFVVCDPTYIGGDIGEIMPPFADEDPERIILLYNY